MRHSTGSPVISDSLWIAEIVRNHWDYPNLSLLDMPQDVNPPAHQSLPMGKQHKKIIKRSRRKEYLKRKNEQAKTSVVRKESSPAKKTVKKAAAKKAATKKTAAKKTATKTAAKKAATKKTAVKKTAKKAAKKAAPKKDEE